MRVDFYLIRVARKSAEGLCCQLCAKAFNDDQQIAIISEGDDQSRLIDQQLWLQPSQRFIPHGLNSEPSAQYAPVVIGKVLQDSQIAINLSGKELELPSDHRLERILEIIPDDDSARAAARERYRLYKQWGAELHTHELH